MSTYKIYFHRKIRQQYQYSVEKRVFPEAMNSTMSFQGLYLSIPGPTMIDLKLVFHASYEEMSRSVSARGVGGFVGALLGGILVDKFERSLDLIIAAIEIVSSFAVTYVPFSPDVSFLWFLYFVLGSCGSMSRCLV